MNLSTASTAASVGQSNTVSKNFVILLCARSPPHPQRLSDGRNCLDARAGMHG
jgi:hypothetical protein